VRPLSRIAVLAAVAAIACRGGQARPGTLDTHSDSCRSCRMPVSDAKLAAQLAAPGEEPLFFDDIACLRDFLSRGAALPQGAAAYVADHRTGAWILASSAVFSRCPSIETPMGSHLLAHADADSRAGDRFAAACELVATTEIFGATGPPHGRQGA
jgi:copper chaperone NosL